tara:strand:- start:3337 stop:3975 length:639 start_codon:yes stop_codon:yes gene_type:complete
MPYNIDGIYDISLIEYNTIDYIKHNTTRKLYNFIDTGHIYTLDTSDNINYDNTILKQYLNNKANYLIQPYNRCQLKVSKFNNQKPKFKQPAVIYRDISCTTSIDISLNQRTIQRQNRVESSLYTMNLAALSSTQQTNQQLNSKYSHNQSDRKYEENSKVGVDIKHNSYARYLAKKKSGYLISQIPNAKPSSSHLTGNKYYKLGLIGNKYCKC